MRINDMEGVTITVRLTRQFKLRTWIAGRLVQFAAFILGAEYTEVTVA